MNKCDTAAETFIAGFNCSQAVFSAFSDELYIEKDLALKISNGFGGGMGRMELVCGPVSGGIMAIGAKFGKGISDGKENQEMTYAKVQELIAEFTESTGTPICKNLLNLTAPLTTELGQNEFITKNLKETACIPCVKKAVEILEPIMKG